MECDVLTNYLDKNGLSSQKAVCIPFLMLKQWLDKFNADLYADKVKPKDKSNMTLVECYEEMKKLKLNSGKWRKKMLTCLISTLKIL